MTGNWLQAGIRTVLAVGGEWSIVSEQQPAEAVRPDN
jgi:hypothetical protein